MLKRDLPPGRYPYKLIIDDVWTYSVDHPTYDDGGNTNNYVDVRPLYTCIFGVCFRGLYLVVRVLVEFELVGFGSTATPLMDATPL